MNSKELSEEIQVHSPMENVPNFTHSMSWSKKIIVIFTTLACAIGLGIFGPDGLNWIYGEIGKASFPKQPISQYEGANSLFTVIPLVLLGAIVGAYLGSLFSVWISTGVKKWDRMDNGSKVTIFVGIVAGLIVSSPVVSFFSSLHLAAIYLPLLILGLTIGFASMAIFALQSMSDILPWYRGSQTVRRTGIKILDTNIIIDGRIFDIAQAGFLDGEIYVPKFVLEELQYIADHHEALRRNRGRRGLEVLRNLQGEFPIEIGKYDRFAPDIREPVDARLVRIAKAIGADIVTNDWNLNSVARLQNVKILSLNELALTLRPNVLPGEAFELSILKEGSQMGQGVGYLDDGTMVVVENGREYIGQTHPVAVSQVIQTERGKMIFAEVDDSLAEQIALESPKKRHQ